MLGVTEDLKGSYRSGTGEHEGSRGELRVVAHHLRILEFLLFTHRADCFLFLSYPRSCVISKIQLRRNYISESNFYELPAL